MKAIVMSSSRLKSSTMILRHDQLLRIQLILVESNYELMTREPQKNCKKAFYDVFVH